MVEIDRDTVPNRISIKEMVGVPEGSYRYKVHAYHAIDSNPKGEHYSSYELKVRVFGCSTTADYPCVYCLEGPDRDGKIVRKKLTHR